MIDAKVDVYMRLYVSEWLEATADLPLDEQGAYLRLLSHMWKRDGWLVLSHDALARLVAVDRATWERIWTNIRHFFQVNEDARTFTQKRLQEELSLARTGREQRTIAGRSSAARRALQREGNETSTEVQRPLDSRCNETPTETQRSYPSSVIRHPSEEEIQTPLPPKGDDASKFEPTEYPAEFELFWKVTNKRGSKFKALTSWRSLGKPPAIVLIASWDRWARSADWTKDGGKFQKHPCFWLSGRMHEQEPPSAIPLFARKPVDTSIFSVVRCEFHADPLNTDRVSFKPGKSCPECKHLSAKGRRGESEPLLLGGER